MPASAPAPASAGERRSGDCRTVTHEPPKLKTPLKTPPKQATNPLQFVKVGPCSLYRTAQEQLQKVQEVKKIKQEIRDDPEDWQSNLDNWKSSRRKRQEHIIERVVEVKKLELEEHDRQRRRSKTFSEMMEERGNRGRKLSISLAMYNEEDANDLSDLGIGTSSGKSSVSGDTHDDTQSVLSDRDSEIDKNHSDVDNVSHENGTDSNDNSTLTSNSTSTTLSAPNTDTNSSCLPLKNVEVLNNGFHAKDDVANVTNNGHSNHQEYDSATTATASSPEPEEYTYESAIRGYVSRVSQNIPRRSLADLDAKLDNAANRTTAASVFDSLAKLSNSSSSSNSISNNKQEKTNGVAVVAAAAVATPVVKVDILKRREIFEKASIENKNNINNNGNINNNSSSSNNNNNNSSVNSRLDFSSGKSIKERLSSLERQKSESDEKIGKSPRHSVVDSLCSVRERFSRDKPSTEKEPKTRDLVAEELEGVKPLRERLSTLEKFTNGSNNEQGYAPMPSQQNGDVSAKSIKDRFISFDAARCKEMDKRAPNCFHEQSNSRAENSTPSERSSSPDSEYRAPRAFHQSLDSLDADASSGPDTFDRVQSLEELDYHHQARRYPTSSSSAEILNDTDREDSGIHTAEASCSVSQADEPIEEESLGTVMEKQLQKQVIIEETTEFRSAIESALVETTKNLEKVEEMFGSMMMEPEPRGVVLTELRAERASQELMEKEAAAERQRHQRQRQQQQLNELEEVEEEEEEEEEASDVEEKEAAAKAAAAAATVAAQESDRRKQQQQQQHQEHQPSALMAAMEPTLLGHAPHQPQHHHHHQPIFPVIDQPMPPPPLPLPPVAVRPTTLALERTTLCSDFLSPLSPVSKQILPLSFSSDEEIVTGLPFPMGPPASVEPPKEKPPPPPVDLSDEENHPIEPLKRLNSTRRIKKELRTRRSDFLGIEGFNDDELERELTLAAKPPPDMATILAEERRIEQLHRRSYDTDSNYEQDSSHERDSGVELGQAEDWSKQPASPDMSQHSRQSSEPFGASVTSSEDDELAKKEREIIEALGREEEWRYENDRGLDSDIGEKLAHKLRELEEEKMQLERERDNRAELMDDDSPSRRRHHRQEQPTIETLRMNEENLRKQDELVWKQDEQKLQQQQHELEKQCAAEVEKEQEEERLRREAEEEEAQMQQDMRMRELEECEKRDAELRRQDELDIKAAEHASAKEMKPLSPTLSMNDDEYATREVLRVKHELLELEQEELKRQRNNLAYREQKQLQLAEQLQEQWKSLQDVAQAASASAQLQQQQQQQSPPAIQPRKPQAALPLNYRSSMPNLQMQHQDSAALSSSSLGQRRRPPPPPIPPAKPLRLVEQRQRDVTIRNSRIPSADSIPQQIEAAAPAIGVRSSRSTGAPAAQRPNSPPPPPRPSHGGHQQQQQQQHVQQMTRQTLQALSAVPRPRIVQGDQWVQRRKSDVPRAATNDYNYQHWLIQEAEQRRINEKNQRSPVRKPHVTGTSTVPCTASPPRPATDGKPLPDSIIQTLTQRVQSRAHQESKPLSPRRRLEHSTSQEHLHTSQNYVQMQQHKVHQSPTAAESQEKMLSVSGKKKCSHCGDELGRGAAMIIESLRLFYHMECFKCCVCHVRLGDGLMGTDVRVRNHKLHCHNCYSSDDGVKFSCV